MPTVRAFAQGQQAVPQADQTTRPVRALAVQQTRYRLRAGERVSIPAPQETIDFVRGAKTRTVAINGMQRNGIFFGPVLG